MNFLSKVIRTSRMKRVKILINKKCIKNNTNINFTKPNIEKNLLSQVLKRFLEKGKI